MVAFRGKKGREPEVPSQVIRPVTPRRRLDQLGPAERRLDAAARAYWRELGGPDSPEYAVAATVEALERAARSPAASEAELIRVAHMTAAETTATVADATPGTPGRKRRDVCSDTPVRLAALFTDELGPQERIELGNHLNTCLACRATQFRMSRAHRAFTTTVAGALTGNGAVDDALEELTAVTPPPTPLPDGLEGIGQGPPSWSPSELRWITDLVAHEHASAYPREPGTGRGAPDVTCGPTLSRLAARARGELSPMQLAAADRHLDRCLACQAAELRILRAERAFAVLVASGVALEPGAGAGGAVAAPVDDGSPILEDFADDQIFFDVEDVPVPQEVAFDWGGVPEDKAEVEGEASADTASGVEGEAEVAAAVAAEEAEVEEVEEASSTDPAPADAALADATPTDATPADAEPQAAAGAGSDPQPDEDATPDAPRRTIRFVSQPFVVPEPEADPPPVDGEPQSSQDDPEGVSAEEKTFVVSSATASPFLASALTPERAAPPGRRAAQRPARRGGRGRGRGRRDFVAPGAAVFIAVLVAVVLLLNHSSSNTNLISPPSTPTTTAAPPSSATSPSAGKPAKPARPARHRTRPATTTAKKHPTTNPAASQGAASPSSGSGATAPVASAPTTSAPPATATPTPTPTASRPSTSSGSGSSSGGGSSAGGGSSSSGGAAVTPQGGNLPPQSAPTQGIGSGG